MIYTSPAPIDKSSKCAARVKFVVHKSLQDFTFSPAVSLGNKRKCEGCTGKRVPMPNDPQEGPMHSDGFAEFSEFDSSTHPVALAIRARCYLHLLVLLDRIDYLPLDLGRGSTVLHFAAWHQDEEVVTLLMSLANTRCQHLCSFVLPAADPPTLTLTKIEQVPQLLRAHVSIQ